jgi:hypothetical protein
MGLTIRDSQTCRFGGDSNLDLDPTRRSIQAVRK